MDYPDDDYPDGHRGVYSFNTVSPFDTTLFKAIPADLTKKMR